MPRIRTIKPEYWSDEKLAPLDPLTRLVFLGLISHADDAGRLIDSIRQLDGLIFPFTEDTCAESLEILARLSRIVRYTSQSGQALIQITGWDDHQRVDKPSKHLLPAPPPQLIDRAKDSQHSRNPREEVATPSRDTRAPTVDHGPRTVDHGPTRSPRARDPVFGDMPSIAVRSIKGLYGWDGSEGTDERVWGEVKEAERPRLLAIAVQRLEGEGKAYQGLLFRRTLETVVRENTHGRSAGSAGPARSESGTRKERQDVLVEG